MTARAHQLGLSYTEVLIAVVILGAALVPALDALRGALGATGIPVEVLNEQLAVASRLEDMLAEPFLNLDAAAQAAGSHTSPSSYSDASGAEPRRLVYLSRYDGDNADGDDNGFTGADPGLLWIRVTIENSAFELSTLLAQ